MKILKDAEMLDDISLFFMKTRFLEMKGKVSAKYDNYLGDKIDYSLIFVFANLQKNSKEFIKHKSLEIDRYLFEMGESQNII